MSINEVRLHSRTAAQLTGRNHFDFSVCQWVSNRRDETKERSRYEIFKTIKKFCVQGDRPFVRVSLDFICMQIAAKQIASPRDSEFCGNKIRACWTADTTHKCWVKLLNKCVKVAIVSVRFVCWWCARRDHRGLEILCQCHPASQLTSHRVRSSREVVRRVFAVWWVYFFRSRAKPATRIFPFRFFFDSNFLCDFNCIEKYPFSVE